MYIYIDESKGFFWEKKKIVFWWLLTNLKLSVIDRLYYEFLDSVWIKEIRWEIKSSDHKFKDKIFDFYKFLKNKKEYRDIEFIWAYCDDYEENWLFFYKIVVEILNRWLVNNKFNLKKIRDIYFFSDMMKMIFTGKNIKNALNADIDLLDVKKEFNIQKIFFDFVDSKKYWWIKFADFIAWILRKRYIWWEKYLDADFEEMFVWKWIRLIKLK